jgi:1-acyl-sn-glycerol-3-phosphate acyltransferase
MTDLSPLAWFITLLRSALFAVLFYAVTAPILIAAMIVRPLGQPAVARVALVWARLHRLFVRFVLGQRIVVEGTLQPDARFVVCKHESMFETLDAIYLFHRPIVAAKRELLSIPVWGSLAQSYGLIVVDREAGASALRKVRTDALAAMTDGRTVIFYPEGTRVPHGESPELKAGFAGLYTMLRVPVTPIAIDSGRLSPRRSFLKRSGTITYRIGEPIPAGLPRAEAEARVHAAINALNPQPLPPADSP